MLPWVNRAYYFLTLPTTTISGAKKPGEPQKSLRRFVVWILTYGGNGLGGHMIKVPCRAARMLLRYSNTLAARPKSHSFTSIHLPSCLSNTSKMFSGWGLVCLDVRTCWARGSISRRAKAHLEVAVADAHFVAGVDGDEHARHDVLGRGRTRT